MISINNRDPQPIYRQVKEQFRNLIVSGTLAADDRLPSVRDLAAQLAINPNTIQRAYKELENEGYIYTVAGRGNFVGEYREVDESRKQELFRKLDSAVSELKYLGVSTQEILGRIGQGGNRND